jgi:hypothetical protein
VDGESTVIVKECGWLRLDGIIVTHVKGAMGRGVYVELTGVLVLSKGMISGNADSNYGVGVINVGNFSMLGGKISNNKAMGTDKFGDECNCGGGVANYGNFSMSGGIITGNTAGTNGGGVYNDCYFYSSSGFYNGSFTMSGGEISNNVARIAGGGVYNHNGFSMSGGTISNNVARSNGGGVYSIFSFNMSGGIISNNKATGMNNNVFIQYP